MSEYPLDWTISNLGAHLTETKERVGNGNAIPYSVSKVLGIVPQSEKFNKRVASSDISNYKVIRKGDFAYDPMLSWDGSINRMLREGKGAVSPAYVTFRVASDSLDADYLLHLLKASTTKNFYKSISKGTNVRRQKAEFGDFAGGEFGFPPLPEQQKIAEILSGIDAEISALDESISRTRLSKQALLRSMVPHASCDRQKGSMEGWTICRLEDVCSLITYGFTNPMPTTPSGVYMVTAKDVRDGRIDKETARFTSHEAYRTLLTDKSRPVTGDILVTKDGTLGRTAIVRDEVVCINQSVALLRPLKEEFAEYLHLLLSAPQYQQTMLEQAGGSAVKHIYITTLAKMEIALPSSSDQRHKIVQTFASFDDSLNAKQRKLAALHNLRLGLASDLLSGRKRVSI